MNNFGRVISIFGLSAFMSFATYLLAIDNNKMVESVRGGDATLVCFINDVVTVISSDMVEDYYPDQGYWKFKNGGAKTCQVNYK